MKKYLETDLGPIWSIQCSMPCIMQRWWESEKGFTEMFVKLKKIAVF